MCFYNDSEWYATISETSTPISNGRVKCMECDRSIPSGQSYYSLHQQEQECCQNCENGYCSCKVDSHECCSCSSPDFGETFDYDCCQECQKFLEAVKDAELEAGCREYESQPSLCGMCEEIGRGNGSIEEARKYFKKAVVLFPELKASGYLGMIYRKMF